MAGRGSAADLGLLQQKSRKQSGPSRVGPWNLEMVHGMGDGVRQQHLPPLSSACPVSGHRATQCLGLLFAREPGAE